jgi:hypothetical protein
VNQPRRNGSNGHSQNGHNQNGHNGHSSNGQRRPAKVVNLKPTDLWRPVPQLPEVDKIVPSQDPGVLLRSLGDPPLMNKSVIAGHYIATVIERAAGLATALAASADLLSMGEAESE